MRSTRAKAKLAAAALSAVVLFGVSGTVPLTSTAAGASGAKAGGCASSARRAAEPSGQAPPPAHAMVGYVLSYCTDFNGTALPRGWGKFIGVPSGDPSGYFDPTHVIVKGGLLTLNTWRDPSRHNQWATGGVCQCSRSQRYGAYFVRSRVTGPGDDEVQLLWPAAHVWPPEVDFNETGARATTTAWYVHYEADNHQLAKVLRVNLTQWHTWGVIWTPHTITFTVDHKVWGIVRSESVIPRERMTLDIQQQTWCGLAPECPKKPVAMLVDWVAEYALR